VKNVNDQRFWYSYQPQVVKWDRANVPPKARREQGTTHRSADVAGLVCSEGNLGLHFNGGRNITVRGLTFDTITPAFTQGEVVASDPSGALDVKIMEGCSSPFSQDELLCDKDLG